MINTTLDILNRQIANAKTGRRRRRGDGGSPIALSALGKADEATRQRAEASFVQPLHTALAQLRDLFTAHTVTRENLPPDLARQWVTPDGQARIDVAPKGDANNNEVLQNFASAVQSVAPDATEGPISILEARRTVVIAFIEAGGYALISIAILLWITLRRWSMCC